MQMLRVLPLLCGSRRLMNREPVTPRLDQTYLLDSQGHRYAALTGAQVNGEGLFEFIPLPLDALDTEQSLKPEQ